METLNKLISELGFDNDEFCEVDIILLQEAITCNLSKLKQENKSFGEIRIIPLANVLSNKLKQNIIENLGTYISFLHTNNDGRLIGIAEDNMDYYYVTIQDDGKLNYTTCVDYITSSR